MYVDMAQSEKGFPVKFDAVQVVENRELCGVRRVPAKYEAMFQIISGDLISSVKTRK
jgi:hypothetical protein